MSEQLDNLDADLELQSELDILKEQAATLGIKVGNISVEKLKQKIADALESKTPTTVTNDVTDINNTRKQIYNEAMKLRRIRIANLDPKKKDLQGEIFTFANDFLGNVKKYVPFGESTDEGYHVPQCIYDMLQQRKFLEVKSVKRNGQTVMQTRWVKEFAIEDLPDLTEDELAKLANAQKAASA